MSKRLLFHITGEILTFQVVSRLLWDFIRDSGPIVLNIMLCGVSILAGILIFISGRHILFFVIVYMLLEKYVSLLFEINWRRFNSGILCILERDSIKATCSINLASVDLSQRGKEMEHFNGLKFGVSV